MAAGLQINRLTNCLVWVDGKNYLGKAEEVDNPEINYKMASHKGLGLQSEIEYFSGIEKMEMRIKLNAPYADLLRYIGSPQKRYQLMVRASLETYESGSKVGEVPYVVTNMVQCKNFPLGKFKQNDNVELELKFAVYATKLEINGEKIYEVNQEANILIINGVDINAQYRKNLGLS